MQHGGTELSIIVLQLQCLGLTLSSDYCLTCIQTILLHVLLHILLELFACYSSCSIRTTLTILFEFQSCNGSGASVPMQREEFIDQFYSMIGRGSREEYERLFDSVDVSREGWVDWHRLASYLLLGLSEKQEQATMSAVPRWCQPCLLPAPHRGQIQSIVDLGSGRYMSVSKEGMIAVWAENLTLLKSHKLHNESVKPKDLWVTAMVVLPNVHKVYTLRDTYSAY